MFDILIIGAVDQNQHVVSIECSEKSEVVRFGKMRSMWKKSDSNFNVA